MTKDTVKIATRKSPLALWQAEYVKAQLLRLHPELQIEFIKMTTQGDKILDSPLAKVGGKGLFVKELELGMIRGDADIAVHSMKDVPVELPDELHLSVICQREDARDAFVSNHYASFDALPLGANVGTSSLRRQCQIRAVRPDLNILDLRGNVNTRLSKLDDGHYDAIILAAAGLMRLDFADRIRAFFAVETLLPAIGQAAVGIECRRQDERINHLIAPLNDPATSICVLAERSMNQRLQGGCQVPIGGYALLESNTVWLRGLVGNPDGSQMVSAERKADKLEYLSLGIAVADELLLNGADKILADVLHNA